MIRINVGDLVFMARLERERAPATVTALLRLLPLSGSLLQARWSGEAAWMPLGSLDVGVGACKKNDTQRPSSGRQQALAHRQAIMRSSRSATPSRAAHRCKRSRSSRSP